MRFASREWLPFSAGRVFAAQRDEVDRIVPYLPDVEQVEQISEARAAGGDLVHVHRWTGSARSLPVLLRPFVRPEFLRWHQTTRWSGGTLVATWSIAVPALGTAIETGGVSRYIEGASSTCTVEIEGDLSFRPGASGELGHVPASAVPVVERFVVGVVVPMIARTTVAVGRYLREEGSAAKG
jgi:hypothetical protein